LTAQDVSRALNKSTFQQELRVLVTVRVTAILNRDLGPLPSLVPKSFQSYFDAGVRILLWRALKLLHSHLDSDAFAEALARAISANLDDLLHNNLNTFLPEKQRQKVFAFIADTTDSLLARQDVEQWIANYLHQKTQELLSNNASLNDILPEQLPELLLNLIENEAPAILEKITLIAKEPETQARIVTGLTGAIETFIASLGPMAALASSFLSPQLIESKVQAYLNDKGDDIGQWLQNQEMRARLIEILRTKLSNFLAQPVSTLLSGLEPEKVATLRQEVSRQIAQIVRSKQTTALLSGLLHAAFENQAEKKLAETLRDIWGEESMATAKEWTSREIVTVLRSNKVKRILDSTITKLVNEKLLTRPIGTLAQFLPKAVQTGFVDYLLQLTYDLLTKEVPGLVNSLNIEKVVTQKVDSLDLLHLEGLLLGIMEEQFKYINIFGGFLGFIIGLLNLVFLFQ
jgi:uncharacterized membrane protein YheB (UPF0754 family)